MQAKSTDSKTQWETYRDTELANVTPILETLGYMLDQTQVHLSGERFLMAGARDVGGGGMKLVLTGMRRADSLRVVIKASRNPDGQQEIERERAARERINRIPFAYHAFTVPRELHFSYEGPFLVSIVEYVTQDIPLLSRPLNEQFFLTLKALECQEGAHATTGVHTAHVRSSFGLSNAEAYLHEFDTFAAAAENAVPHNEKLAQIFRDATHFLHDHRTTLERYAGFLTHADFAPNNFRVRGHELYLLDYASIHFGNKYESWARFLNFMVHHNPDLERTLARYVKENRGPDEYLALQLMRVYKIGFLLKYYAEATTKTEGATHELMQTRLSFWTLVMQCILDDCAVPPEAINTLLEKERILRTEEEKARQREMIGRA